MEVEWLSTPVINPMAVLETVFQNYPTAFDDYVGTGFEEFWNQVRPDDPKLINIQADMARIPDWKKKAMPYLIHGDGAVFTTTKESLVCVSMKCLLAQSFAGSMLPLMCQVKGACTNLSEFTHDTMIELWSLIVHFLIYAYQGIHAPKDEGGDDWPPGSFESEWAGKPCHDTIILLLLMPRHNNSFVSKYLKPCSVQSIPQTLSISA